MLAIFSRGRPRSLILLGPRQSVSPLRGVGFHDRLNRENGKTPHSRIQFVNVILRTGLLANLYSRLGRDPSCTLYTWNNFIKPWVHRVQIWRSKTGDVEGGDYSGQPNSGPQEIPQQTHPRVGYGVAGAAMLPAIL